MKKFKKSFYLITAQVVPAGTHVYNFLEDVHYVTDEVKCVVLTGTAGEKWPISKQRLAETYNYLGGKAIDIEDIPKNSFTVETIVDESAKIVHAEQTTMQLDVTTSWGAVLKANRPGIEHADGDWIVYEDKDGQPNYDKQRVVNGVVFARTYVEVN